jgi:hypothetical protein
MAPEILDYSPTGRISFRQLPWRRIALALLALYFAVYGVLRVTGAITHTWGMIPGIGQQAKLVGHNWDFRFQRGQLLFIPAIALEMAVRDLGHTKSP